MKYLITIYIILILPCAISCKSSHVTMKYPEFISKEIKKIEKSAPTNPPTKIYSYTYQNRTVYYFSSYCCDIPSRLFDDTGVLICQPDGGITGKGDMKCLDFFQNATHPILVWEDNRAKVVTQ